MTSSLVLIERVGCRQENRELTERLRDASTLVTTANDAKKKAQRSTVEQVQQNLALKEQLAELQARRDSVG